MKKEKLERKEGGNRGSDVKRLFSSNHSWSFIFMFLLSTLFEQFLNVCTQYYKNVLKYKDFMPYAAYVYAWF